MRGAVDRTGEGQGGETRKLLIQTASSLSLVYISIPVLGMEPNTPAHAWQSLYLLSYMFSPHTVRGQVREVGQKKDDIQGEPGRPLLRAQQTLCLEDPERTSPYNSTPQRELVLARDIFPIIGNKPAKANLQNSNLTGPIGQGQGRGMSPGGREGMISPRCGKERARGTHLAPHGS